MFIVLTVDVCLQENNEIISFLASIAIYDPCKTVIKRLCQNKDRTDNGLEQITMLREVNSSVTIALYCT